MSEYTHIQEILHETKRCLAEADRQFNEAYASWLASNADLNDSQAEIASLNKTLLNTHLYYSNINLIHARDTEIAELTSRLATRDATIASFERDLSLARALLSESNRLLEVRDSDIDRTSSDITAKNLEIGQLTSRLHYLEKFKVGGLERSLAEKDAYIADLTKRSLRGEFR